MAYMECLGKVNCHVSELIVSSFKNHEQLYHALPHWPSLSASSWASQSVSWPKHDTQHQGGHMESIATPKPKPGASPRGIRERLEVFEVEAVRLLEEVCLPFIRGAGCVGIDRGAGLPVPDRPNSLTWPV